MNFQSWKFGILDDRKQLNTTDCWVFILAMAMKIATKEIIFHALTTINLRYWTESQCLSHKFPRNILKQIKNQVERIAMPPRFQIDTSKHVYDFLYLFHIKRRKENKTFRNEGLGGKSGKKISFLCFCNTMILWLVSNI